MKLVTLLARQRTRAAPHFNPHEREARDCFDCWNQEAKLYFNPHEREARDAGRWQDASISYILIHTSVKLVTSVCYWSLWGKINFNPHEREARDEEWLIPMFRSSTF